MEGVIILLLLAILAVPIILLVWVKTSTGNSLQEVIYKLNSLNLKVDQLHAKKERKEEEKIIVNENLLNLMDAIPEKEPKEILEFKPTKEEVRTDIFEKKPESFVLKQEREKKSPVKAPGSFKSISKKRDLEKFIGENLINKIGIGILVLGIAYFVRYAIDKNWISEIGRVATGILSGGVLALLAHRIRKSYTAFSSVLVGGAMAIFYYSISIGFHDYQLFSQPVAFFLMVLITGFSVLLSITYNRKELAILGLVGAFSTPLMVANGGGNYQVLFSYLAIVNVGMLVLAYFKKWNVVNILSLVFTTILFGGWFLTKVANVTNPPYVGAIFFAGLFYVIFFLMHMINNVKEKRKFKGYEFGLLLSTTSLFYAVGMSTLYMAGYKQYQGLFTMGLGIFNLIFTISIFKREHIDKSLIFLLIGMVLTFVSLAGPVQLSGNYITLFWTTEMVLLLWLSQKSGIRFMKFSSLVIFCLMLISLIIDWQQIYFSELTSLKIILNKGFVTTVFSIAGSLAYLRLLHDEKEKNLFPGLGVQFINNMVKGVVAALIYLGGVLEINYQILETFNNTRLSIMAAFGYSFLFILGLFIYAKRNNNLILEKGAAIAGGVALVIYPMLNGFVINLRDAYLSGNVHIGFFLFQYVNLALIALIISRLFSCVRKWFGLRSEYGKVAVWGFSVVGLLIASAQLNHMTMLLLFDQLQENAHFINEQTVKIGYPIIWGLSSFVLMLFGMRYKYSVLRVISLAIFSVLLLKLFLFDIQGASEAGKIVAFILLGVLLLVISFMYQKLKNLLLDNSEK